VAVGDDIASVEVGALAFPSFQVSCGTCERCQRGHSAVCTTYPTLSDYGMEPLSGVEYGGMLSDLVRVPHADTMLTPLPADLDPVAMASVPDNVLDGYRSVAPHLARRPGVDVLLAIHGMPSIGLYAAQTAVALGAASVTVAASDDVVLELAERVGADPVRVDFGERPPGTWPFVVDCGPDPAGLSWAIRATEPEGLLQCVASLEAEAPLPLLRVYTLGIELHFGRAHSASLLPEVAALVGSRQLRPELVTTEVVDWDDAPKRFLEPTVKLIIHRPQETR
jgi:alcohol dehydrogenase